MLPYDGLEPNSISLMHESRPSTQKIGNYFSKKLVYYSGPAFPVLILLSLYVIHNILRLLNRYCNRIRVPRLLKKFQNLMETEDIDIVENLDDYPHSLKNVDIDWTIKESDYFEKNYQLNLKSKL
mgnify:CR=1 FL=1